MAKYNRDKNEDLKIIRDNSLKIFFDPKNPDCGKIKYYGMACGARDLAAERKKEKMSNNNMSK